MQHNRDQDWQRETHGSMGRIMQPIASVSVSVASNQRPATASLSAHPRSRVNITCAYGPTDQYPQYNIAVNYKQSAKITIVVCVLPRSVEASSFPVAHVHISIVIFTRAASVLFALAVLSSICTHYSLRVWTLQ